MTRGAGRIATVTLLSAIVCRAVDFSVHMGTNKPYLDEGAGLTAGGSVRFPVTRRLAVRPEILAGSVTNYSHTLVLAGMTFDFTDPAKKVVGYVSGSGGTVRTRDSWLQYTSWRAAVLGGFGVRIALGNRWTTGAEFRVGSSAFPMVTFNLGYRWRSNH